MFRGRREQTFAGLALGVLRGTRGPSPLGSILAQVSNDVALRVSPL